jgi:hypothetical protein
MSHRVTLLALTLFALAALAGAATLPAPPAALPVPPPAVAALPAPAASPAWLLPVPNSSVEKPNVNAKPGEAPLGAVFQNACSQSCLTAEIACFNGCDGDQSCKQSCSDDYYCCLRFCTPNTPLCP